MLKRMFKKYKKDSCFKRGHKSPCNQLESLVKSIPNLTPAEQQYESYVRATVAANSKCPVEDVVVVIPPAPLPRRFHTIQHLTPNISNSSHLITNDTITASTVSIETTVDSTTRNGTVDYCSSTTTSCLTSPNYTITDAGVSSPDTQALSQIREQMALSLSRMKDLEEQVKLIPSLQNELVELREEKDRLQQSVLRKEDELQKTRELVQLSSTPSSVSNSPKYTSPVHFQPQRISPIALESMGYRLRSSTNSPSDRSGRSMPVILKRDVGTMCPKQQTHDVAVGEDKENTQNILLEFSEYKQSNTSFCKDVACSTTMSGISNINDVLYTKEELDNHLRIYQKQQQKQQKEENRRKFMDLKINLSKATQTTTTTTTTDIKKEMRAKYTQTLSIEKKLPLKINVGVDVKPETRETFVSCKPEMRSIGCSNDSIQDDILCEKCKSSNNTTKYRTVAINTETISQDNIDIKTISNLKDNKKSAISLNLLMMPTRSKTITLGDNEKLHIRRKNVATQYLPVMVCTASSQTTPIHTQNVTTQIEIEMNNSATQSSIETLSKQTDTKDLQILTITQVNKDEISSSMNGNHEFEQNQEQISILPLKTRTISRASNTEIKRYQNFGVNTDLLKSNEEDKSSMLAGVKMCHNASNTEIVQKRDIGCGETAIKPHISISCADNYCDSCKDAIKNLAKHFSKSLQSPPTPPISGNRSIDSKIPRPKTLSSPLLTSRKSIQRQNTYTITPSPTPSPIGGEGKLPTVKSIKESLELESGKNKEITLPYDLSQIGDNDLVVREEKKVSISWSRDNSPAPADLKLNLSVPEIGIKQLPSDKSASSHNNNKLPPLESKKPLSSQQENLNQDRNDRSEVDLSAESRNLNPLDESGKFKLASSKDKSSQVRVRFIPAKEVAEALKTINNSLLKKLGAKPIVSVSLKTTKMTVQQSWFQLSSSENAEALDVSDFLDFVEKLSLPLLDYCVNMVDSNGNTALHYAVSHGNFDVVSLLLDSKICNVNQMNNAGYTSVMLVSLAKFKDCDHRTVVERLFRMADVNIRARKHSQTALMLAVSHGNLEMIQLLLAAGADLNIQDEDGSTALMCAAEHGRGDIVKHLLSHSDCDSLIQDMDGSTAFKIAWQAGHREIGLLLYVHEQMLRSKLPNRGETTLIPKKISGNTSRYHHKRNPSK